MKRLLSKSKKILSSVAVGCVLLLPAGVAMAGNLNVSGGISHYGKPWPQAYSN